MPRAEPGTGDTSGFRTERGFEGAACQLQKETAGERMGIGLIEFSIDRDPSGEARIVTPVFGTPSAELGMRPRDVPLLASDVPAVAR